MLSRLQAFLPQIASANEALASRAPEDVDIENVGEGESQYVEMVCTFLVWPGWGMAKVAEFLNGWAQDLGLGVYNALMDSAGRDAAGRDAAPPDSESGSEGSDSSSSDESSSEEESSSSEEESDEPKGEGLNEENSAVGERASIPKAQKRVLIEEIKETKSESQ